MLKSKSYYLRTLGTIFRAARRKKGLTQKIVAESCCFTEANYHKIEYGDLNFGVISLFRICEELGIIIKFDNYQL